MNKRLSLIRLVPPLFAGLATLTGLGCVTCNRCQESHAFWQSHEKCDDIPPGAIPVPAGTFTRHWKETQAAIAETDQFTVHLADWIGKSDELGPFGNRRLEQMARRLDSYPGPIVVESSEKRELDELRRQSVVVALASRGLDQADDRVVVGRSDAYPLYAAESSSIVSGALGKEPLPSSNSGGPSRPGGMNLLGGGNSSGF
jgi:hypothetical protein